MYNKIIVGYDQSEPAKAALKEASLIAKKNKSELTLVHVAYFNEAEFSVSPQQHEKRIEDANSFCREGANTVFNQTGVKADSIVSEGEPHEILTKIAREKDADLIAIGTYGTRGFKRVLLGNVSSQILLESPCDVMVVKKACNECTGVYESILVPYDGSEFSRKALMRAISIAKENNSSLSIIYVIPRYEEMIEFFKSAPIKKVMHDEAEKLIHEAKNIATNSGIEIHTEIREGHSAEEIISATNNMQNCMIVMGTHGWKGFSKAIMGSTTRRVITHASCPVIVVK